MKFFTKKKQEKLVLLDFFANWCAPCQTMEPIVDELIETLSEWVEVIRIEADSNPKLTSLYKVSNIPSFILLKDQKIVWRQTGLLTKREMVEAVQKHRIDTINNNH